MALDSPLMRLPRELRNNINEFIILDDDQNIKLKSQLLPEHPRKASFISSSPVILVCRQVHDEYFDSLEKVALSPAFPQAVIETEVTDLDFENVIAFVSKLSKDNIKALNAHSKLHIKLINTRPEHLDLLVHDELPSWVAFCRETGIEAEFEVDGARCGRGIPDDESVDRLFDYPVKEAVGDMLIPIGRWLAARMEEQMQLVLDVQRGNSAVMQLLQDEMAVALQSRDEWEDASELEDGSESEEAPELADDAELEE